MQKILLIEDDIGIITPLKLYIEQSQYECIICQDGNLAKELYKSENPILILLDINLPGKNGIELCQEIREITNIPIIVLSARESEDDKVLLFGLGADDYVSKPFSPRELMARIATNIKRYTQKSKNKSTKSLELGNISIDPKNYTITRNGEIIHVTKTEFSLIEYFSKNRDIVIKRETLMKEIIGYDHYLYDRTLDTHIKNLRKKLNESIDIETIRGIGYKIHIL